MYLLYTEYQNMGGTLDETAFADFEFEARAQIDWYTFNRLQNDKTFSEAVKRCMYKLIQLLQEKANLTQINGAESEEQTGVAIASQSNDGVSISYNVLSASEAVQLAESDIKNTIHHYLQSVVNELGQRVLYRGLYQGEQ